MSSQRRPKPRAASCAAWGSRRKRPTRSLALILCASAGQASTRFNARPEEGQEARASVEWPAKAARRTIGIDLERGFEAIRPNGKFSWPTIWGGSVIKSELVQRMAARNPHLYQRDIENIID